MIETGFRGDQSNLVAITHEPQSFARNAETDLHFGTDRNELDEVAQRLDQELTALVAAIEADLFAEQT